MALETACAEHSSRYRQIQQALFAYSFDLTEEPSSDRAARAVADVAGLAWPAAHSDPRSAVAYG
jgi:hypothetical protein